MDKKYDLEERFVKYAADMMNFAEKMPRSFSNDYLAKQIIRSAGSATLNFGEVQGAGTDKDYINKCHIVFKELKETELNLRIMGQKGIDTDKRKTILGETVELIKIIRTIIANRKKKIGF